MKKEKWSKERAQRIRDRHLRGYLIRLILSICRRIKSRNGHTKDVAKYEDAIAYNAQQTVVRYRELVEGSTLPDMTVNEQVNTQALVTHLLKQAHDNVPVDHPVCSILEDVISDYNRLLDRIGSTERVTFN